MKVEKATGLQCPKCTELVEYCEEDECGEGFELGEDIVCIYDPEEDRYCHYHKNCRRRYLRDLRGT